MSVEPTTLPQGIAVLGSGFDLGPTPTSYTMDHSAGSYVYDQNGRLRLSSRYGLGSNKMAADIKQLIQENAAN
jgi:protein SCO1/2